MKVKAFILCTLLLIYNSIFAQKAQKIDEIGETKCDNYLSRIDNVQFTLNAELTSKIYLLIYEGKESVYNAKKDKTELVSPTYGLANAKIRSIKEYFKLHKQENLLKRIVFVKAGFREEFIVEVWTVPLSATPPQPTPTLTKMKYRKGKPQGFCIGCC